MSRRLIVICALLALVVAAPARATAPTTGAPKLVEAGDSTFPERSYVLTLPSKTSLRADQLHVTENGQPVVGLTVVPSTAAGQTRFGTVLVIDASNSMRGKPFTSALAAARAFAARRGPTQPLAVIVFNARTAVLTPFTTSDAQIATALRSAPGLAQGTHIYDAIQAAVSLLERAHIASGSIVLLSDGADVGSVASSEDAVAAARKAHARVFTVGLRSAVFDAGTLARIAAQSGGDYSEAAKAKDLEPIFARLGYELSNQYLLRYRSLAGPDKKILVRLDVQGVSQPAVTGYVTPSLALTVAPPYKPAVGDRLIQSGVFMLVIALLVTALLILGLVAVFRPSGSTLLRRLSYFVTLPTASDDAERELRRDRLFAGAEKTLKGSPRWERFKENLEVAEIPIPAARLILWPAIAVLFFLFLAIFLRSFLLLLPALFIPLAEWQWISQTLARKRRAFADQLPDNLEVLASALRAGHSLVGALSVVIADSPEPARAEFRRVIADERLGVPLEDALGVVVRRMDNRDLDQVALVAALQHETGGNAAEVLDRVTETIRERQELRRLVRTLTAQGRLTRWILTLIPVGLLLSLVLLNRDYVAPLFHNTVGQLAFGAAIVMVTTGSLVIRKIVDIKV